MNKNAWLKELSRELERRMPDREREDTLRYYEEYFEEAGPEREGSVLEELGDPGALARRLAEEGGWTERKKAVSPKLLAGGIAALVLVAAVCLGGWLAARQSAADPPPSPGVSPSPGTSQSPAVSPPQSQSPETPPVQTPGPETPAPQSQPPETPPPQSQPPETPPPQTASPSPAQSPQPTQPLEDGFLLTPEAFTQVEADIPLGDLTLRAEGDAFRVVAEFGGTTGGEPYRIECALEDGTLKITAFPKSVNQDGRDEKCYAQVTVTVPEGTLLDRVELSTALGDVDVCRVRAGSVDAHTALGDVWASNTAADTITLDTNLGDVDGKDLDTGRLTMDSRLGSLSLEGAPAAGMDLHTNMGDIDLELSCSAGECSYELSSNMGTCSVDGSGQDKSARQTVSGAAYRLDAHTNMGAVRLSFTG